MPCICPSYMGGRGRREQIIVLRKSIQSALIAGFMWLLLTRCQHPGEPGHSEKHFYRAVAELCLHLSFLDNGRNSMASVISWSPWLPVFCCAAIWLPPACPLWFAQSQRKAAQLHSPGLLVPSAHLAPVLLKITFTKPSWFLLPHQLWNALCLLGVQEGCREGKTNKPARLSL